jgi:DNA-binding CsgD family transcriptional regulator
MTRSPSAAGCSTCRRTFRSRKGPRRNKQIADDLHVSLRTVEADVRDLKTVLGVRSRAQIAAWATQA